MGDTQDVVEQLAATIREAAKEKRPLCIRGGGTKDFYGGEVRGDNLYTGNYRGIVEYEPTELVITARAGTPLAEVEAALRERGQMPPRSRRISVRFPHRYPTSRAARLPPSGEGHIVPPERKGWLLWEAASLRVCPAPVGHILAQCATSCSVCAYSTATLRN